MQHHTPRASTSAARYLTVCLAALLGLLALALGPLPSARAGGVIYVRSGGTGNNTGTSWADAFTNLQNAIAAANSGDQLWVAAGTYTPTTTTDRTKSFGLKSGVAIYGGFAGTETQLGQRDWANNITILSGDIGTIGSTSDNSYHVVTSAANGTLDGFTISYGNANSGGLAMFGGGILTTGGAATLSNLIITSNLSYNGGAGIYNNTGSPTLTNVTISNNASTFGFGGGIYNENHSNATLLNVRIIGNITKNGGGIFNAGSNATLTNVTISGNQADNGGGMSNTSSNPIVTNTIISGNTANNGGGILNSGSSPTLTNVTISGNRAASDGGGIQNYPGSAAQIRNSIIWGNAIGSNPSAISNLGSTATITNSIVEGGYSGTGNLGSNPQFIIPAAASSAPTSAGDYRLQLSSPALDAGDDSVVSAATDLAGNPRRVDLPGIPNPGGATSYVDIGAYEMQAVNISSITRQNPTASFTDAASVTFRVVFAESLSGVDASDFAATQLSGSLAGASVTGVSGSGTTYSVTADTGSGQGVLRLEPAPTAEVVNASGLPAQLSTFTAGESYTINPCTNNTSPLIIPAGDTDSLITAINCANLNSDTNIINLTNSTYRFTDGYDGDDTALPSISTPMAIEGNGAIIERDSNATSSFRLFRVGGGTTTLTIKDLTMRGGSASDGGAIYNGGMITLINSTISGNSASNNGGGIANSSATIQLINSTVSGNSAGANGGGVYNFGSLTATNSTISGNSAGTGGGLYNVVFSNISIYNSTIAGNTGAGLYNNNHATVKNSIIYGNGSQISGSGTTDVTFSTVEGRYSGIGNQADDPLFADQIAYSLAPTASGDYHLRASSPAIDKGNNADLPADSHDLDGNLDTNEAIPYDHDGNARVADATVDMGAYEPRFVGVASITGISPPFRFTNRARVSFVVFFDESLSDVDASDVAATVVSGNIVGASVSSVTGSGTMRFVSIDTGTGEGELRLDIVARGSALDSSGLRVGLLPYSNGGIYMIDKTAPQAPVITGITTDRGTQASGVTRDSTISLNGTAEPNSTIALARVGQGVIANPVADGAGSWSFDYTSTSLPPGSYSFTAKSFDSAGNLSASSATFVVTVLGPTLYVNDDATGADTGASWADAFTSLQSALSIAKSGDQIWVAAGRYIPSATGDRSASFALKDSVAVYGGFAGSETQLSQRNWMANLTTLSGDLNGDDSGFTNNAENSYHVVIGASGATLDGFTISGGNAGGSDPNNKGGGIYNTSANLRLGNLVVSGNTAMSMGGGLHNEGDSPSLANVTVSGNTVSKGGGGGLSFLRLTSATLTDITISGNAAEYGGGMFALDGSLTIANATVTSNTATMGGGGGLFFWYGRPTLINVTISGNSAPNNSGGGILNQVNSPTLTNVTLSDNTAQNGGGMYNLLSSATLITATLSDNTAKNGGALYNQSSTTTLVGGLIGDNMATSDGGGIDNMLNSKLTLTGVTLTGNQSSGGLGGGLFNNNSIATLANTIISSNSSKYNGGGAFNHSSATLTMFGNTVSGNSADFGGGIDNRGKLTLSNSSLSANSASSGGGGISAGGTFTVTGGLVRDNIVTNGTGGGLQIDSGVGTVTNTTFSGNQANGQQDDGGGAIMSYGGTLTLNNLTIAGNSTTSSGSSGGGGGGISVSGSPAVTLKNTIVAGNTSSAGKPDVSGTLISGSHNLVGDTTGSTGITNSAKGDLAGNGATPLAPKLAALADNGGPTETRALLNGSPAIDAGDAATCAPTDQRGYIRLLPCDIGAYEAGASAVANQQPTLDQPANLILLEDAGQQTINLSGIGAGAGESQLVLIGAVSSNPALIPSPTVNYANPAASGSLSFTPAPNTNGTATITVTVLDSGGTNGGGVDTLVRSFTVQVGAVNDAPDFTAGPNQTVKSSAGPQMVASWATGFNPGPADEASQTLLAYTVIGNSAPELFSVVPAIDSSGTLTYTPKPGASGTATIGLVVRDSGDTGSGGVDTSIAYTFTISIDSSYTIYLPLALR